MFFTRLFFVLCFLQLPAHAGGQYLEPDEFVRQAFALSQTQAPPKAKAFWLTKTHKNNIQQILAHDFRKLRLRYWQQDKKSAWILNEIGKEKPITIGVVINDNKIENIQVLAFRESRGSEIRHDFFTRQFIQTSLTNDMQLDRTIDGISGATLSVRAITKIARIALYLSQQISVKP
jgi:FMN-binding protein